ncbi:MAG: hypothetical protein HPY45_08740 [Anaerolineae bacterium]|nr:hypothetical protein [Anaerolineae bacterium]
MNKTFAAILEYLANFFAHRKGLLPMLGILLVILNLILRLWVPGWLSTSDLLLHLGIVIAILGFMLAWAL